MKKFSWVIVLSLVFMFAVCQLGLAGEVNAEMELLVQECMELDISAENVSLFFQQREEEHNENLQEALRQMIHNRIHQRLKSHAKNEDCTCEECDKLRLRLRDRDCICEDCTRIRLRLRDCDQLTALEEDCGCDQSQKQEGNLKGEGPNNHKEVEVQEGDCGCDQSQKQEGNLEGNGPGEEKDK